MLFYTPLRYPGGKGKLSAFMKSLIVENELDGGTYYEPYCGGAAIGLHLLLEDYIWDIVINDADYAVYAFWDSVLTNVEVLSQKIYDTPVSMDTWLDQKNIYNNPSQFSRIDLAFAMFFLNRTNRSGILKGGVIGGKNQDGPYKIDARYNRKNLVERIQLINSFNDRIKVTNVDAVKFLRKEVDNSNLNSIIYLDPPYYNKGNQLYRNYYKHNDHKKIANIVQSELNIPWLVSYDNTEEINNMYLKSHRQTFTLTYSAHTSRPKGTEVMFFRGLKLPSTPIYETKREKASALKA